jgi:hypothetical protein
MAKFLIIPEPLLSDEANAAYYIEDAKDWDQAITVAASSFDLSPANYRVIKFGDKDDQVFSVSRNVVEWTIAKQVG